MRKDLVKQIRQRPVRFCKTNECGVFSGGAFSFRSLLSPPVSFSWLVPSNQHPAAQARPASVRRTQKMLTYYLLLKVISKGH